MRFQLNPVWVVSLYPVYVISGICYIRFGPKNPKEPFCNIVKFTKKRYIRFTYHIRNSIFPVCVKSGMGCVIVEGDYFTVKK